MLCPVKRTKTSANTAEDRDDGDGGDEGDEGSGDGGGGDDLMPKWPHGPIVFSLALIGLLCTQLTLTHNASNQPGLTQKALKFED